MDGVPEAHAVLRVCYNFAPPVWQASTVPTVAGAGDAPHQVQRPSIRAAPGSHSPQPRRRDRDDRFTLVPKPRAVSERILGGS